MGKDLRAKNIDRIEAAGAPKGWRQVLAGFVAPPKVGAGLPLAIGLASLGLVWWTFDAKLGISGDNCEFIILARSLAQGMGMSYINLPDPEISTKFPFGFPLLLAPLAWLFPQEWLPMKWLVAAFFIGAMPLYYFLVRHRLGQGAALWATAFCATNLVILDYADQVMSEIPYLTFSLLALLLLEQALAAERAGRAGLGWWLGVFFSLLAAYYIRTIALSLLVAVLGYLLAKGKVRRAAFLGGGAFLAMALWALRNRGGVGGGYFYQLIYVNPYRHDYGLLTFKEILERMALNAQHYFYYRIPAGFYPEWGFAVSAFVISLSVAGAVLCVKRKRHLALLLYAVFFGAVLIIWPWTSERFLLPLIPVLVFLAVYLAAEIGQDLQRRGWGRWGHSLLGP